MNDLSQGMEDLFQGMNDSFQGIRELFHRTDKSFQEMKIKISCNLLKSLLIIKIL